MKRIGWGTAVPLFLLVLLIGSLGLNSYLFGKTKQYYWELNATRLDPLGLSEFPVGEGVMKEEVGVRTAVFFGDSRAAQWPDLDGLEGYRFFNRGIGSQTSVQVAARFQAHVAPLEPDVIIVQMCINDLKTIPLFPQNEQAIIQNCLANIDQVLAEAEQLGTQVILTTVFPVGDVPLERRIVWSPAIAEAVKTVNEQIRSKASDTVFIFDSYALLADTQDKLALEFAHDELHLNDAGYTHLNANLIQYLHVQESTP
ncbi:MAG: SGNH/GDSL hydrolase family protein [Ardenticatenaceae bacterium]|nr:SGNH/GDSL hydrolase family protein [Ardenticatenaceae bacterium]